MDLGDGKIRCPCCNGDGQRLILVAALKDVHPSIADKIRGKNYDKVSLEIYPTPPEGVPGNGIMARRLALLGGQLPQIKDLASLPTNFSERLATRPFRNVATRICKIVERGHGVVEVFSEVVTMPLTAKGDKIKSAMEKEYGKDKGESVFYASANKGTITGVHHDEGVTMNREEMLAKLEALGVDVSGFTPEAISDEALENICGVVCEHGEGGGEPPPMPPDAHTPGEGVMGEPPPEIPGTVDTEGMVGHGGKNYSEGRKKFAEHCKKRFGEEISKAIGGGMLPEPYPGMAKPKAFGEQGDAVAAAAGDPTKRASAKDSRESNPDMNKFSEDRIVAALEKRIAGRIAPAVARVEQFTKQISDGEVTKFCENMLAEGRIKAADLDETNPKVRSLRQRLLAADATTPILKFSEGGKVIQKTERDLQMDEIRARPSQPRRVMVRSGQGDAVPATEAGLIRFAESNPDVFAAMAKVGTSQKEFVETYKLAKPEDRVKLLEGIGADASIAG